MLKVQEIRQLGDKDLLQEIDKTSRDLFKLKMDLQGGHAKESHQAKMMRRYIATMKTVKREREMETPKE
ncbi:MAG TPA: 50S ribosomal protein L29 [Candidatus Gracilibacteria bacterium]|nr:50S ribosomal protein L29 [Candidatus Gracilibacteria bacterium]